MSRYKKRKNLMMLNIYSVIKFIENVHINCFHSNGKCNKPREKKML